jgi:hypothetical protein
MATLYSFITPKELASADDPLTVLRTAPDEATLRGNPNFDPDHTSLWARAAVRNVEQPPVQVTNLKTDQHVSACICQLET